MRAYLMAGMLPVSSKCRYAVRVLEDLACEREGLQGVGAGVGQRVHNEAVAACHVALGACADGALADLCGVLDALDLGPVRGFQDAHGGAGAGARHGKVALLDERAVAAHVPQVDAIVAARGEDELPVDAAAALDGVRGKLGKLLRGKGPPAAALGVLEVEAQHVRVALRLGDGSRDGDGGIVVQGLDLHDVLVGHVVPRRGAAVRCKDDAFGRLDADRGGHRARHGQRFY
jgi:hypothetical protein